MGTARAEHPASKRLVLSEEVEAVPVESVVSCRRDTKHTSNNKIEESLFTNDFNEVMSPYCGRLS